MLRRLAFMIALAAATTGAATQDAQPQSPQPVAIVMYATAWCPYCAKARAYFKRTNTAYIEHDIERSADAHAEFRRLGGRGVPLILVGSEKLRGFNELAFESAYARAERAR